MNQTFTFYKPNTTEWRINDTYNVTFEEGVLYSEGASKSPPQDKPTFWNVKVENDKSVSTTKAASTHITDNPTHNKSNTLTTTTQSWTSSKTLVTGKIFLFESKNNIFFCFSKGEPPISRSAKLGIGLSISFFVMILIAEIAYFKFFYRGGQRNRHD